MGEVFRQEHFKRSQKSVLFDFFFNIFHLQFDQVYTTELDSLDSINLV